MLVSGIDVVSHSGANAAGSGQLTQLLNINIASAAVDLDPLSLGPLAAIVAAASSGRPAMPFSMRYPTLQLPPSGPGVVRANQHIALTHSLTVK